METDRELLELAAKAAGIEYKDYVLGNLVLQDTGDALFTWNPLTRDGDALRLAVKLRLSCQFTAYYAVCYAGSPMAAQFTEQATMGYSIEAATRRAITRASAAIGEQKGKGI